MHNDSPPPIYISHFITYESHFEANVLSCQSQKVLLVYVYIPLLCLTATIYQLSNQATFEVLIVALLKNSSLLEYDMCHRASNSRHIKGSCAFKMSVISYPNTQHHITKDWHILQITVNFIMQSTILFYWSISEPAWSCWNDLFKIWITSSTALAQCDMEHIIRL
jgi:hypothetical protein